MVEIYFNVQSDNGSITDEHALRRWSTQYLRALEDRKDLRIGSKLRTLMTEAGFVEVDTKMIPLPLSAWSTGWYLVAQDERTRLIDSMQTSGCETSADTVVQPCSNCSAPSHYTH